MQDILNKLETMTAMELSELVKAIEVKFDVTAAAPTVVAGAASDAPAEEEKSEFDVQLLSVGDKKIAVIKAIREITGLGLKEAKGLADSAPSIIKEAVAKEEAEKMKTQIEDAGGQVDLK